MRGTKIKVDGIVIEILVGRKDGKGNPLHFGGEILPHLVDLAGVDDVLRKYFHKLMDSYLDQLNEKWNSIMSPPTSAALIVAQLTDGNLPKELGYLMDDDDPVTKLIAEMQKKWDELGLLKAGESGDMIADSIMRETLEGIKKIRPDDPIVPMMSKWLERSASYLTKALPTDKPKYLN
ncbi:MAG: hypothetical protein ACYS7Y_31500 [Planctomycetota bacterium]|jgi:hypothetical protein